MKYTITVLGTGYVGLVTGACFAELGHTVYCVDISEERINTLNAGGCPIYEPGLEEIIKRRHADGHLLFTTQAFEVIPKSDIVFTAVGTPPNSYDGSANLDYVMNTAATFAVFAKENAIFVLKSTVPVGTNDNVRKYIEDKLNGHGWPKKFDVVSNPEFLKEGEAVNDFFQPARVVLGTRNERSLEIMKDLYSWVGDKIMSTDPHSAELIKYASNAMLATRISFINEIASLCDAVGADVTKVAEGMGLDDRIGSKFLNAGCGYGGSCFPKDVKALIQTGDENQVNMRLLKAVEFVNEQQKPYPVWKGRMPLDGYREKKVLALGLAFKPGTDDVREAPSMVNIISLLLEGATVYAYDPVARETFKKSIEKQLERQSYALSKLNIVDDPFPDDWNMDAIMLFTEWPEFKDVDWRAVKGKYPKLKIVIDGRNALYDKRELFKELGVQYVGVGVKPCE